MNALGTVDKNLRLALIDEVYCHRHGYYWLDAENLASRYEALRDAAEPPWANLSVEPELVATLEALILELPVATADLDRITDLTLDGDRVVYMAIWNHWWHQGDHFVIGDLSGLALCPNLQKLHLGQGLVDGASLKPLLQLPKLRDLSLCYTGKFRDVEVLGQLTLDRIWAANVPEVDGTWSEALSPLRAAGTTFR